MFQQMYDQLDDDPQLHETQAIQVVYLIKRALGGVILDNFLKNIY